MKRDNFRDEISIDELEYSLALIKLKKLLEQKRESEEEGSVDIELDEEIKEVSRILDSYTNGV